MVLFGEFFYNPEDELRAPVFFRYMRTFLENNAQGVSKR